MGFPEREAILLRLCVATASAGLRGTRVLSGRAPRASHPSAPLRAGRVAPTGKAASRRETGGASKNAPPYRTATAARRSGQEPFDCAPLDCARGKQGKQGEPCAPTGRQRLAGFGDPALQNDKGRRDALRVPQDRPALPARNRRRESRRDDVHRRGAEVTENGGTASRQGALPFDRAQGEPCAPTCGDGRRRGTRRQGLGVGLGARV